MQTFLSFLVGVLSSIAATGLIILRQRARFRLRFQSVLHLIGALGAAIRKDGFHFDHILTIGRNSGVAGSILAGEFGLEATVSVSTVKSRLKDGARTIELDRIGEEILPALAGERVLVFICCNDSGATLAYVVSRLTSLPHPPAEIRTAALYTAPSPAFMPQYTGAVLGKDTQQSMTKVLTGLPWVTSRWLHPLAGERLSSNPKLTQLHLLPE